MSFLSEILAFKGQAEIDELNDTIKVLNKTVVSLKEELLVNMEDRYMNFTHALDDTNHLDSKMRTLLNQIDDFKRRLDDLMKNKMADSKDQLEILFDGYQEISLAHKLSQQLLEIHKALEEAQDCSDVNLAHIAQQLKTVEQNLKNNTSGLDRLEMFESVKAELICQQSKHINKAAKLWNQGVCWSESLVDNQSKTITLTLASHVNKNELFRSFYLYDMLSLKILDFGRKLLNDILFPIISNISAVECKSDNKLSVTISKKSHTPVCKDILNNLKIVFDFLYSQFNLTVNEEVSFMSELKKHYSEEFCTYLINNCLSKTVPKRRDELEGYKAQMEEITAFESVLKERGFIDQENTSIAEYATNVEELFATKTCEAYSSAARKIMKKDLHDIKQVGPILNSTQAELNATGTTLSELSPYTYNFPNCQISKSCDELLALVSEMLSEVPHNTDTCAVRLFYTARNIFSMYCEIVPQFHSRLLDTIPQQSAILHNNAMYLAHQLMLLGVPLRERLPPVLQCHTATFVDLVDPLRTLAATTLTKQLLTQQKHVVDILRDSGLVTLSESPKFPDGVEKAIRQCLRQFALLQTVWQHILPVDNYCKAIGLLCNTFVIEIIDKVIAAEDISADTASQLVIVIDLIQQKAPQVFPEPLEVQRHVKKWGKLCELRRVLGAELREVGDRWADGKGPLAHEFTPEQVRHLVRALFQISDRRAVLLAKIF